MSKNISLLNSRGDLIIRCVSYTNFSTSDPSAVSRSQEQFRHLEQHTFGLYPDSLELTLENGNSGTSGNRLAVLQRELAKLGPLVNEITFDGSSGDIGTREFLKFIEENFRQWTLKGLKFANTEFESEDVEEYAIIFEKLDRIELSNCFDFDDEVFEILIRQCKELKELTLIDLEDFDGNFLGQTTDRLESLHLRNVKTSDNCTDRIVLKIGNRTKSLILRDVSVVILCPSKDLSNLHTLKLCLIKSMTSNDLLCYTGKRLKHLHLAKVNSDGSQICEIGDQLETVSLLKCPNFHIDNIYKLLEGNKNLRSVKLCNVGDESMFHEVPRRVPKVEELCIWPNRENQREPINFDDIVSLPKLKSFTFISPKYSTKNSLNILSNLVEQLTRMDTLESVGILMRPNDLKRDTFKEKLFRFQNLKSLKLVVWGPQSSNQKIAVEIATHLTNLSELKILNNVDADHTFDNFHDACCCRMLKSSNHPFYMEIAANQFTQILCARERAKAKGRAPLKIYQSRGPHKETARMLANQTDAHKNVLQVLPLDSDGFFEFFAVNDK